MTFPLSRVFSWREFFQARAVLHRGFLVYLISYCSIFFLNSKLQASEVYNISSISSATWGNIVLPVTASSIPYANVLLNANNISFCNNNSTSTIYYGFSTSVSTSNGFPIYAQACEAIEFDKRETSFPLFFIPEAGDTDSDFRWKILGKKRDR